MRSSPVCEENWRDGGGRGGQGLQSRDAGASAFKEGGRVELAYALFARLNITFANTCTLPCFTSVCLEAFLRRRGEFTFTCPVCLHLRTALWFASSLFVPSFHSVSTPSQLQHRHNARGFARIRSVTRREAQQEEVRKEKGEAQGAKV